MCTTCSLKPIYSFPSAASFAAFDADLTHRLATQQLTAVPLPAAPALGQVSAAFACADCPEVWLLSDPDNAWRGFFLPQAEAIRYVEQTQTAPTTRRLGCLVVGAMLVLLLIWRHWG